MIFNEEKTGIFNGIVVGFMTGKIQGIHKYIRVSDGKTGVIYSNGNDEFVVISPDDIIWTDAEKSSFSTQKKFKINNKLISFENNSLIL